MAGFNLEKYQLPDGGFTLNSSTFTTIINPIDVSRYDKFCLTYENPGSASYLDMKVQAAMSISESWSTWVDVPTATIPVPSALGASASAVAMTSAVDSCFKYIRVRAIIDNTATTNGLIVRVAGFQRF